MKWKQIKREASAKGWYLLREGKRHEIWAKDGVDYEIQLGRHESEEIKTGLYHKLKKQIGF